MISGKILNSIELGKNYDPVNLWIAIEKGLGKRISCEDAEEITLSLRKEKVLVVSEPDFKFHRVVRLP
ncbi:MAG: hypothetical protein WAV41_03555 [Microgenomates group bacterium]